MAGKRVLTASEKEEIRERRRAKETQANPGAQFFIHVADETDANGEPLVSVMQTDVRTEARNGSE